jgi:hypothetical protein
MRSDAADRARITWRGVNPVPLWTGRNRLEPRSSAMASARERASDCMRPRTAEVTVREPCFLMPRIDMHVCSHSTTTMTPLASSESNSWSAIWLVKRSCTCGRRA